MCYLKELMTSNPLTWLTREIRTNAALRFIPRSGVHVDIGCGPEEYLLSKSPCSIKIGFDKQLEHLLHDKIPLEDKSADCITMLAVIEHLALPSEILTECHRILKDDGILIITTPKSKGLWLMKIYDPRFEIREGDHKQHYDYKSMSKLVEGHFAINKYLEFELGFNQIFVLNKLVK